MVKLQVWIILGALFYFISNILIYYVQYVIFQRIFLEYMVDDKNVTINDYVIVADVII